ncbi:class I SAM-dependent methyltransferase [Longirhabdus pacifica]|uniref:class I SAM-dependent methyltransferase n=1 Tax=Longirhabdus pacifica TaxID=2305227 RepID=UPI001009377E|nr:class I SAM-dependent methyltransferase [Longirhabdus pacifica]
MAVGKKSTAKDWDESYKNKIHSWNIDGPSPELVATIASNPSISRNGTALDLGCGLGNEAMFLAECGLKVYAVDHSEEAIKIAKNNYKQTNGDISWICSSIENLPIADNSIDFVNDRGCFHVISLKDRKTYVNEVLRVLKPNGIFLLRGSSISSDHWEEVNENSIHSLFSPEFFQISPIYSIRIFSDEGGIAGNLVLIKKI